MEANVPFFGFCSRKKETSGMELHGKPVVSHEYLVEHMKECFLIIPTVEHYDEAIDRLERLQFPEERMLPYFCGSFFADKEQYFEFPQFFPKGRAFVDVGCYDGDTSLKFVE